MKNTETEELWQAMATEAEKELFDNIMPLWTGIAPDEERGGFHGFIRQDNSMDEEAPKGLVMHARLLWAFSAVCRFRDETAFRDGSARALAFLREKLADPINGGYWWQTDADGRVTIRNKVVYGQAFALYGLSEALRVSVSEADTEGLRIDSAAVFSLLERYARDYRSGGYREILREDWTPDPDGRLSDVDIPCFKSMNTNLHVLEAYTCYYRVRPEAEVAEALESLLKWFIANICDESRGHLILFLDEEGRSMKEADSYGHDIEAAWLLREAVHVLGDRELEAEMEPVLASLAESCLAEGFSSAGAGLDNEKEGAHRDTDRHWWVQAEAVVGFRDRWEADGRQKWAEASRRSWNFIRENIIDRENGEWLWGVREDGTPMDREKGGLWKTPYHNGRTCMELIERITGSHSGTRS